MTHKWSSLVCTVFLLMLCVTGLPLIFHDEVDLLTEDQPQLGMPGVGSSGEADGLLSLDAMMEQPNLKGAAWQQLKPLVGTIGRDVR